MTVGDPNLDPELRTRAEAASDVVPVLLAAAARLPQPNEESMAQVYALGLYGSMIEQFSACVLLAQFGEPTTIPIILRSTYEALVDLDNLVHDASYHCRIEHANIKQTLSIMRSGPLRETFQKGRQEDYEQLAARLGELENEGKASLPIWKRCRAVGRSDEYDSLYALFCLDTHNNASALAERHLSESKDGSPLVSFFGKYDPKVVASRLDFGLQFLFQGAQMVHGAFRVPAPEVEKLAARFDRERAAHHVVTPERAMSFQQDGFLEASESARIATIRERHAPWFALVERLNRLAMKVLQSKRPKVNEEVYLGTLYARAVTMFQGVVRLAERGMAAESRTLVRACAETAIALGCVRRDKTFFDRLDEDYDKHRIAMANDLLRLLPANDPNLPAEQREDLKRFVKDLSAEYKRPKPQRINWADAAVAAGMIDLYMTVYRETSSDAAHVSLKALERHLETDGKGTITGFRFHPEFRAVHKTLTAAIASLLHATEAKLFGAGDVQADEELRSLALQWDELVRSQDRQDQADAAR